MALERSLLDPNLLGPAARKALAPGPAKMMAAKGLAPIADPVELVSVLYQLSLDGDAGTADSAQKTLAQLPERVLEGALASSGLDARVLDLFAEQVRSNPRLLETLILNASTADETLAELAGLVDARAVDLIAQNEERLLRHPPIIAGMYSNMRARMSTVDRAVEFAIRNQIVVPGIAAWDELVIAFSGPSRGAGTSSASISEAGAGDTSTGGDIAEVLDQETQDELFAALTSEAGEDGEAGEDIPINKMSIPMKIRLASLGSKFQRGQLIRDRIKLVAMATIRAGGVNEMEAAKYASNHSLLEDVITYIANKREWTKLYGVKLSLIQNPKTPIAAAIRFLPHLREKDLRQVARSKGISSAVAAAAKKRLLLKRK